MRKVIISLAVFVFLFISLISIASAHSASYQHYHYYPSMNMMDNWHIKYYNYAYSVYDLPYYYKPVYVYKPFYVKPYVIHHQIDCDSYYGSAFNCRHSYNSYYNNFDSTYLNMQGYSQRSGY